MGKKYHKVRGDKSHMFPRGRFGEYHIKKLGVTVGWARTDS